MIGGERRMTMMTADERWAAVCARDAAADGTFVFAVQTTGVYCRPHCASRRPLRANVAFFDDVAAARAAGFRACRRCRPDEPAAASPMHAAIERACRALDSADVPPTLAELAAAAGKSPAYFQRAFTRVVGISPREYAAARRDARFRTELTVAARVADAAYEAGFGSSSRAYANDLGMTPAAFRAGGRGLTIGYATAATPLGWVAVAATERGVAAVELADDREAVRACLAARFPHAELRADDAGLADRLAAILRYLKRPADGLRLPLDVQGTAFTRRVWRALLTVEPGATITYGELAARIGRPSAARAVARACAANPVALAIPCHRAVPARGGSGGYRWGAARKEALLLAEADAIRASRS